MKKSIAVFFAALFLVSLCSCQKNESSAPSIDRVTINGTEYLADYTQNTITFDGHICSFDLSPQGDGVRLELTYPDGSTYWWVESGQMGYGGWSDDYDESRYVSGDVLRQVLKLEEQSKQSESHGHPVPGLLLLVLGAFNALKPETAWMMEYGWRFKNAQPSDLALSANRLSGVLCILLGIALFFI